MKVLFIINSPFLSGAEISVLQLLQSINVRKYNIFIVLPYEHKFATKDLDSIQIIALPFIWFSFSYNPIVLLRYCLNLLYCSFLICRIVKTNSIDIIYSNSTKSHVYGLIVKVFGKRKSIWHLRDTFKMNFFHQVLTRYCDKVICVSRFIHSQITNKYLNRVVLHNGIDTEFYKAGRKVMFEQNLNVTTVTMVSQITRWKNIEHFVHIARLVKDLNLNVQFIIAGDCLSVNDEAYKEEILHMINHENLGGTIVLLGWVDDIRSIYRQTDVLVHTAINEPFGRTVAEAMSMEIPVIAYDSGGPGEIILNGETGFLIEPNNYASMTEKLIELIDSCDMRRRLGQNGRKRIQRDFSLAVHVKSVERIFEELHAQYSC